MAVIRWLPTISEFRPKVAEAGLPESVPVPICEAPSRKVTVPVAGVVAVELTVAVKVTKGSVKGKGFLVEGHYAINGKMRDSRESVDEATYRRLITPVAKGTPEGMPFADAAFVVTYFEIGGLVFEGHQTPWLVHGFLFVFTALWVGVTVGAVRSTWVLPRRMRRLCRYGEAASGKIIGQKKTLWAQGKGRCSGRYWQLTYEYTTASGERLSGKMRTLRGAEAYVNKAVIVLYDPARAEWSVIYEYCEYEVEGAKEEEAAAAGK